MLFNPEGKLLLDHASVPDAILRPDGEVWLYFVNGQPGQHGIWVAKATSSGEWHLLGCVRLDGRFNGNAVDPDIVRLPDGRYRLLYYEGFFVGPLPQSSHREPPHPIFSAISEDGVNFTVERQAITVEGVTDPSVIRLHDGSWLMALSQGQRTLLAGSKDGLSFALTGAVVDLGGVPELALLPDGRIRLFVTASGIQSLVSADGGRNWTPEPGARLSGSGGRIVADPSLVAMADKTWIMFYKVAGQPGASLLPPTQQSSQRQFTLEDKKLILSPGYADPSVILMPDGKYLMYVMDGGGPAGSPGVSVMSSNDGITWTRQTGVLFGGAATARAFQETAGIRLYYPKPKWEASYQGENPPRRIASSFSPDGLSGWRDEGIRVEPRRDFSVGGPGIVRLKVVTYRMFFHEAEPKPRQPEGGFVAEGEIWGASSQDGLTWTRDSSPTIVYENSLEGVVFRNRQAPQVLHPSVIFWPEQNGYLMLYNSHSELFAAFSQNGFSWQKLGYMGIRGADSDIIRLPDGRFRIYWGGGCKDVSEPGCTDPQTGKLIVSTVHTGILKITMVIR